MKAIGSNYKKIMVNALLSNSFELAVTDMKILSHEEILLWKHGYLQKPD